MYNMQDEIAMMAMVTQPRVAETRSHEKEMESFLQQVHSWLVNNPPEVLVAMNAIGNKLYLSSEGAEMAIVDKVAPLSYEGGTFQRLAEFVGLRLSLVSYDEKQSASFYARATND